MTPRAVRRVVIAVCALGVAGMIVGTIAGHNGAALTAGLVTAAASLCLMVATAVTRSPRQSGGVGDAAAADVETRAAAVEERVEALRAQGADEAALRDLVRAAVHLGQAMPRREGAEVGVHGGRTPTLGDENLGTD